MPRNGERAHPLFVRLHLQGAFFTWLVETVFILVSWARIAVNYKVVNLTSLRQGSELMFKDRSMVRYLRKNDFIVREMKLAVWSTPTRTPQVKPKSLHAPIPDADSCIAPTVVPGRVGH